MKRLWVLGWWIWAAACAAGQSSAPAVSPQVEQLYAEAKSAEQQGDPATAIAKYKAMIAAAPRLGAAYNNLGVLYFNEGDYADAVSTLSQGLRVDPSMKSANALLGQAFYETGDYRKAQVRLETALRADPRDDRTEMFLARTYYALHEPERAVPHLKAILARDAKDQEALYWLGKIYLQLSQNALAELQKVNPDSALSHEVSGEVMEGMNNAPGALVEYRRAVAAAPDEAGARDHLANLLWAMGKWKDAVAEFQTDLQLDPGNCTARWKMADSELRDNAPAEAALHEIDRALAQCPTLMQAHVDRARALMAMKKPVEGLPDLLAAEKASPEEPSIHFLLGQVYRAQGKQAESDEEMATFARLDQAASEAVAKRAQEQTAVH